jgi:hypothetical protein
VRLPLASLSIRAWMVSAEHSRQLQAQQSQHPLDAPGAVKVGTAVHRHLVKVNLVAPMAHVGNSLSPVPVLPSIQ